jgi:23S rRNA (adenine2503-C2)-methyltransferase
VEYEAEVPEKQDLRSLKSEEVIAAFAQIGEPAFRAKQVHDWLWAKSATDFDQMTNLSVKTRQWLAEHFAINAAVEANKQISTDKTIKTAFRLHDGHLVEGVLIPTAERMTACVSSQVGCSLTCKFCATGYMERKRNLEASEMYDQVVLIRKQAEEHYQLPLTNIVYMGMGEPLLNYQNVLKSIEFITSDKGLNMAAKRITVSTAGIAKMIKKLGDDEVRFNLALSLHAANDEKRNEIMPINESNTLEALAEALNYFYDKTGNRITMEYIAFKKFNDSIQDAQELVEFVKKVPSRVNIIQYNPIAEASFINTDSLSMEQFKSHLEANGVIVNIRRSRGKDIDAACGQLANKTK